MYSTGNDAFFQIMMTEETMMESGENFQTVTLVPSETNGELSYVFIVQPNDKEQGENLKLENDLNIYNFDNEDLDDSNQNIELIADEDRVKVFSTKKPLTITKPHMCSYCTYTTSKK